MSDRALPRQQRTRAVVGRRRRLIVVIGIALVLLPIAGNTWTINRSRRAMVGAVETGELAAARAEAADAAMSLNAAMNLANAAADHPGLASRLKARDRVGARTLLDEAGHSDTFRQLILFDNEGVVASIGGSGLLGDPKAWQPGLHAVSGDIVYTATVTDDRGRDIGGLAADLNLDRLMPQLLHTRYGRAGSASLVTADGLVLASGNPARVGLTVTAPAIRSLLGSERVGVAQHWEPALQSHQITAVVPIGTERWSVVVGTEEAEADKPAASLGRHLAVGMLVVLVISAGLLFALVHLVVENRRAIERMSNESRRLAMTDPLTGVANRRALDEQLAALMRDRTDDDEPLTLTLIDLDHFKQLNDRHGHQAGDQGLRNLAAALASAVRDTDLVARLGGDEFAIVQQGVDEDGARVVLDRVREGLASSCGTGSTSLSFSAGISSAIHGEDPDRLVLRADRALYREKERRPGRRSLIDVR